MEQLHRLDSKRVVEELFALSHNHDVALLCFETPLALGPWCHRGLVSAWLHDQLGLEVFEFGQTEGCGWAHPKLPVQFLKQVR
jgi:hypothetical protein